MTAKRLTNNGLNNGVATIGLDIGYGVTKATTGEVTVAFPSVMAHSRELKFKADETAAKYPGDQVMDDDGAWFVGDLALSQARAAEQISLTGRTADESALGNVFRLRLAKAALGKLFPHVKHGDVLHARIATGLPVDHMRDSGNLKLALTGQHLIQTDQCQFVLNITEVMVMPQPYGTIYSKMLTPRGEIDPCHTATRTGVCDVGRYTVDLALDDDGEYIDAQSGSVEAGVHLAQEIIAGAIEREYREKPSYRVVETVLRTGCLQVAGQPVSFADVVQEALQPLRDATLALMSTKWQTGAFVDVIYLSGGGAALVEREVRKAYKQAVLLENAQLANATGYLNYARFAAK